ncbi:MAG: putative 4-mercaptohistidine N1-methyltransferase [Armatimonadetes bacterium]|nr:putative 4-mercaptohistidine N1-methyltransferase [Armatimonadota bacterium]
MPNPYESQRALSEYLLLHYGGAELYPFGPEQALGFPARCVSECLPEGSYGRALDLGCAVGRSSFELSRCCRRVLGIDRSSSFIETAERLRQQGVIEFEYPVEGAVTRAARYRLSDRFQPDRVRFEVGDATALPAELGSFEVVLAANLLCRLPEPRKLLDRLADLVEPRGTLILTTPCSWMEEFTPREHWIGGFERDGQPVSTLDGLKAALSDSFELRFMRDMPFLIREHARKFQYCVAQASCWRRL